MPALIILTSRLTMKARIVIYWEKEYIIKHYFVGVTTARKATVANSLKIWIK